MSDGAAGSPPIPAWRRWALPAALLLLLMAALGWWWWTSRQGGDNTPQRQQLQALLERQKALEDEISKAKPPDPTECPPGRSL